MSTKELVAFVKIDSMHQKSTIQSSEIHQEKNLYQFWLVNGNRNRSYVKFCCYQRTSQQCSYSNHWTVSHSQKQSLTFSSVVQALFYFLSRPIFYLIKSSIRTSSNQDEPLKLVHRYLSFAYQILDSNWCFVSVYNFSRKIRALIIS